jgi:ubiquitin-like 1-activating enzyme E1 B
LVDDFLRLQLGYGEELSVQHGDNILYDPEEDANLTKTFDELGLKGDSFITIVDDAEEDAKVDLALYITEKSLDKDTKPIHLPEKVQIGTKPKASQPAEQNGETNGHSHPVTNGLTNGVATGGKRKREADEAEPENGVAKKREKIAPTADDDVVVVDDDDGAILIDDD